MIISIDVRQHARTFEKFRPGTPRSVEGALHIAPGRTLDVTKEEAAQLKAAGFLFQVVQPPAAALPPAPAVVEAPAAPAAPAAPPAGDAPPAAAPAAVARARRPRAENESA